MSLNMALEAARHRAHVGAPSRGPTRGRAGENQQPRLPVWPSAGRTPPRAAHLVGRSYCPPPRPAHRWANRLGGAGPLAQGHRCGTLRWDSNPGRGRGARASQFSPNRRLGRAGPGQAATGLSAGLAGQTAKCQQFVMLSPDKFCGDGAPLGSLLN